MNAFHDMLAALSAVYADAAILSEPGTAHVVAEEHMVLSRNTVPGVELKVGEGREGLEMDLVVAAGARIENPIHSCIGFLAPSAVQRLRIRMRIERDARATILAHCLFPNAEAGRHLMDAVIEIGSRAVLTYIESHYHGEFGGIEVRPDLSVSIAPGGRYLSDFSLTTGRVGNLAIAQRVQAGDDAVAEIAVRVFARGNDEVRIHDELVLSGRASRGLIKTRIALADDARAAVVGVTHGNAEGARGHMDCLELVRDRAVARAEPVVAVAHPLAKVTHEAAVGTVDQDQLETLMARGLSPEQAIDVIVTGILR